jgi:hypothetical protein
MMNTDKNAVTALGNAPEITITVNDETVRYFVRQTDAPKDYDGFGTIELADFGERIVLIREEHFTWQTQRYSSGLKGTEETLQPISLIADEIWKRISGRKD